MSSASQKTNRKLELLSLGFVLLVQLLVCFRVRETGFLAVSDDDYARVVIANEFAQTPTWDPSGTSWLPFPFLLTGSAMLWLGVGLATARDVAVTSALAGAALLYAAARCVGTPRLWSMAGSVLALSLPYAAILSVSTVPEYLTACLLVFAACAAAGPIRQQLWGSLALMIACASRYEAWPVAGAFALLCLVDAAREKTSREKKLALLPATLALLFPFLWLIHGINHHGNPLFFVKRVVDYKSALGAPPVPIIELGLESLRGLLFAEPLAICLAFASGGLLILGRERLRFINGLGRAWFLLGVMVLTLIGGAVRGGAPTHHSERALLACWLLAALSSSIYVAQLRSEKKSRVIAAMLLATGAGLLIQAGGFFERQGFAQREAEERIGKWLKAHPDKTSEIALFTPDYGYFAVMAAHGRPDDFHVLESHDPRAKETSGHQALSQWLRNGGCRAVADSETLIPHATQVFSAGALAVWQSQECGKLAPEPQAD